MLRLLHQSDLESILLIEQAVQVAPWSRETFNVCFHANCFGWAVENDSTVIGFILCSVQHDECHILNLGIALNHQRQGHGRRLLELAIKEAKKRGLVMIYLEVRASNSRAIALYQQQQFQLIGKRKNYYPTPNGQEDALVLARSLI